MTDIQQIVLAKRPEGDVTADCFRAETVTLPALADGQILVAQRFLSLDPYMRPRMTELRSYTPPFELDKPLTGGSVGEVVESKNPRYAKGDMVMGMLNWATHTVHDGKGLRKIDPGRPAPVGLSRRAGHAELHRLVRHQAYLQAQGGRDRVRLGGDRRGRPGGRPARQARRRHVVGCAGDEQKCQWAVREAGYDACFNHKTERDVGAVLDKLCPKGIDADFENVGGKIFHAVFARLNNFGRVAFCGAISEYQDADADRRPEKMFTIVQRRLTLQGFIVSDHVALMGDFVNEVGGLVASGKLKSRETVIDGLAKAPEAFMGLLKGENFGKLVVKVG